LLDIITMGHMEKIHKITILTSITAVLLFSVGFIQESEAGVTQGQLTIVPGCVTVVSAQNMVFSTGASAGLGTFVQGTFTVRDTGNQAADISVDDLTATPLNLGNWHTVGNLAIILAADTDYFTGSPANNPFTGGTNLGPIVAGAPVDLGTIQPDGLVTGNANDVRVDIQTELRLTQAFTGDLFLDIVLVNDGCV